MKSDVIMTKQQAEELLQAHTILGATMLKNLDSHKDDELVKTAYKK